MDFKVWSDARGGTKDSAKEIRSFQDQPTIRAAEAGAWYEFYKQPFETIVMSVLPSGSDQPEHFEVVSSINSDGDRSMDARVLLS